MQPLKLFCPQRLHAPGVAGQRRRRRRLRCWRRSGIRGRLRPAQQRQPATLQQTCSRKGGGRSVRGARSAQAGRRSGGGGRRRRGPRAPVSSRSSDWSTAQMPARPPGSGVCRREPMCEFGEALLSSSALPSYRAGLPASGHAHMRSGERLVQRDAGNKRAPSGQASQGRRQRGRRACSAPCVLPASLSSTTLRHLHHPHHLPHPAAEPQPAARHLQGGPKALAPAQAPSAASRPNRAIAAPAETHPRWAGAAAPRSKPKCVSGRCGRRPRALHCATQRSSIAHTAAWRLAMPAGAPQAPRRPVGRVASAAAACARPTTDVPPPLLPAACVLRSRRCRTRTAPASTCTRPRDG